MDVIRRDICGVTVVRAGTEFICTKTPHTRLRLVRPEENARNIKFVPSPHVFESRYPYRNKEM